MTTINAQIDWMPTNMSQNANVCNYGLFWTFSLISSMRLKGIIKIIKFKVCLLTTCHNIHIQNTFVKHHKT